jgi:hypothetical protein
MKYVGPTSQKVVKGNKDTYSESMSSENKWIKKLKNKIKNGASENKESVNKWTDHCRNKSCWWGKCRHELT